MEIVKIIKNKILKILKKIKIFRKIKIIRKKFGIAILKISKTELNL